VAVLDGLGFAPETDRHATRVRLRQCPLLEAAREQPDVVCSVHLGIVRGALGAWGAESGDVTLVPFAEPGACLLHVGRPERDS
jgi:predicted ArsR family transcriptional regulator